MKLFISYSLAPTDIHIASLLGRQAQAKGLVVNTSKHQNPWNTGVKEATNQSIRSADIVIAIVSVNSQYETNVQDELGFAVSLGKPVLALIEKGIFSQTQYPGIQYVEFERHDIRPALAQISSVLEEQKKQRNIKNWLVVGGLALLALYLLNKE